MHHRIDLFSFRYFYRTFRSLPFSSSVSFIRFRFFPSFFYVYVSISHTYTLHTQTVSLHFYAYLYSYFLSFVPSSMEIVWLDKAQHKYLFDRTVKLFTCVSYLFEKQMLFGMTFQMKIGTYVEREIKTSNVLLFVCINYFTLIYILCFNWFIGQYKIEIEINAIFCADFTLFRRFSTESTQTGKEFMVAMLK